MSIIIAIIVQLIVVGIVDSAITTTELTKKHRMIMMWVFTLMMFNTTHRLVQTVMTTNFNLVDNITQPGITLSSLALPIIPVTIMLGYWVFFCKPGTKEPFIHLSFLYLFFVFLVFIYNIF